MCENPNCRTDGTDCCPDPPPPPKYHFHCNVSELAENCPETEDGCAVKLSFADAEMECANNGLKLFQPRTADDASFLMNQPYEVWIGVKADTTPRYLYNSGLADDVATQAFLDASYCSAPTNPGSCATIREDKGCSEDVDCTEKHYFICADQDETPVTTCAYNNLGKLFYGSPTDEIPPAAPEIPEDGTVIPTAKELPVFASTSQFLHVAKPPKARRLVSNYGPWDVCDANLENCHNHVTPKCKPENGYTDNQSKRYRGASIQFKKDAGFTVQKPLFRIFRSQCLGKSKTFGSTKGQDPYSDSDSAWKQQCSINGKPVETTMLKGRSSGWPDSNILGKMTADQAIGEYFMPFWNFNVETAYPDEDKAAQSPGSECEPAHLSGNRPGHIEPALFEIKEVYTKGDPEKKHRWWGAGNFEFEMDRNIFDAVWDLQHALTNDDAIDLCYNKRSKATIWGPQTADELLYIQNLAINANTNIWITNHANIDTLCGTTIAPNKIYIDSTGACSDATSGPASAQFLCGSPNLGWGVNQKSFTYTTGYCTHGGSMKTAYRPKGHAFQYSAHILEIDNNPPTFKTPCDWRVNAGCGIVYLDLEPEDADGDSIGCRWSTSDEASEMAWEANDHPDEAFYWDRSRGNCVLAYDPSEDLDKQGNPIKSDLGRPLAIQVEDFDSSQGTYNEFWYLDAIAGRDYFKVKSSMPLVFMAVADQNVDEAYLLRDPNFDGLCAPSQALMTYKDAKTYCEEQGGSLFSPQNADDIEMIAKSGEEVWLNVLAEGEKLMDKNTAKELFSDAAATCGIPTESDNVEKIYVSATGMGVGQGIQCNVNQHVDRDVGKKKFICTHPLLDCHSIPPNSCALSSMSMNYQDAVAACQAAGMELAMPKTDSELEWFRSFGEKIWTRARANTGVDLIDDYDGSTISTSDIFAVSCTTATTFTDSSATNPADRTCVSIEYDSLTGPMDPMVSCNLDENCSLETRKYICSKPSYTNDMACYNKPVLDADCQVLGPQPVGEIDSLLSPERQIFAPVLENDVEFLKKKVLADGHSGDLLLGITVEKKGENLFMYYSDGTKVPQDLEPCTLPDPSESGLLIYNVRRETCFTVPAEQAVAQYYIQRPKGGCSPFEGCTIGAAWVDPSPGVDDAVEIELNQAEDGPKNPILIPWKGVLTYDGKCFSRIRTARWTQKPYNMICPKIDGDGTTICTWRPEVEQLSETHKLCGICEPAIAGSESREHCLTISFKPCDPAIPDICAFERENLYRDIIWSGEGAMSINYQELATTHNYGPTTTVPTTSPHTTPFYGTGNGFSYAQIDPEIQTYENSDVQLSLSRVDVQLKVTGDYNTNDIYKMFDDDDSTFFVFDEPCGEDYINELKFSTLMPELNGGKVQADQVIFEKITIRLSDDYVALSRFDNSLKENKNSPFEGFSIDAVQGFYCVLEDDDVTYREEKISSLIPTDDIFTFEIRLKDGAIVANQITLKFHHASIKISELKIHWKECVHIPYLSGNFRPGQVIIPGIDREICAVSAKPASLASYGLEIVKNGDILQAGPYDVDANDHVVKQFTWSAIKKSSGVFTSLEQARDACKIDGKELIYPFVAAQEAYWTKVAQGVQASLIAPDKLYAVIGLTYTHRTFSTGKFTPPGQLKPLSPGQLKNGYTNFWNSNTAATASAAFVEYSRGNAFYLPTTSTGWTLMDMTNPPADWNVILCMGVSDKITNCKNLDDCVPTNPDQSECRCPDGNLADPDPDNDPLTQDLETCPDFDACTKRGFCSGTCENEKQSPYYRCGCKSKMGKYDGIRYQLGYDGRTCLDINECEAGTHLCDDQTTDCINLEGGDDESEIGYKCVCKRNNGITVDELMYGKFSCLECPCTTCTSPYGQGNFCPEYSSCDPPIDLQTDLTGLQCPGDFKCEDYKNLKCPIGKAGSCSHVSDCEFDCESVGTGWFCPLSQCLARKDCQFRCVDDTHCPESVILANGGCSDQSECCPECGKNFGLSGKGRSFVFLK